VKTQKNRINMPSSSEGKVAIEFPIVGIGASAGGLDPIRKLLETLPVDTGMSFVVIQHLASGQESMLPEILSRSTQMKVLQVKDGMMVEKNQVYVIIPGTTMTLKNGYLKIVPKGEALKPINDFMVSLSTERKTQAIGIVLSGTGNDGTEGLKAIKIEGGITFVQDPETAQYPDMPKNAINAETAYFILSPENIARELVRLAKNPQLTHNDSQVPEKAESETDLKKIHLMLKASSGVDFTHYKETTINRRITRRRVINKIASNKEYVAFLRTHPNELLLLFDDLLIGVTSFFREPKTFEALAEKVFPELVKNRSSNEPIRVWVPGCSTGEEVYSVAIAIQEFLEEKAIVDLRVQIFGTDANEKNIEKARQGIYPKTIEDKVFENRLKRFFNQQNGNYQITKLIRDMCIFAKQDITSDPPFSNLDLIMCRNVLIYFDSLLHERVFPIFHYGLKPNGFLVLGESESIGKFHYLFEPITTKGLVYKKKRAQPQVFLHPETFVPYVFQRKTGKQPEKPNSMVLLKEEVDRLLMAEFVPATLLVSNNLDILFFRGQVNPYLTHDPGTASLNVTKMVRKELRTNVQTAIYLARKENKTFKEIVEFKNEGQQKRVSIQVKPLKTSDYEEPFFLVTFDEPPSPLDNLLQENGSVVAPEEKETAKDKKINDLKGDLESTKQSLQTIIEVQEATNEELRSTMEEAQSSNEELQSTNEELETAKEELQSGNEELQTLNEELKNRNRALGLLNDDLTNLQTNIDTPVVIVDNELRIRRFTVSAQKFLKISPSDVGRPITDLKKSVQGVDLGKTIYDVTNKLIPIIQEVVFGEDRLCEMQVRPYLTEEKKIDGAVLSFIDITERKKYEALLLAKEHELSLIYANVPEVLFFLSVEPESRFRFITVSKSFRDATGLLENQVEGKTVQEIIPEPSLKLVLEKYAQAIRERKTIRWEEVTDYPSGKKYADVAVTPFFDSSGRCTNLIGSVHDGTERKKAESSLRNSEQRYRTLFTNMDEAFFLGEPILDSKGNLVDFSILEANSAFEKQTGLKLTELLGKTIKEALPGLEESWVQAYCNVALTGKPVHFENYNQNTQRHYEVYSFSPTKGLFASLFTDITARKILQYKLKEYSENLEKLVEERTIQLKDSERLAAIGTTAGMVGHDIRNPLQAITGDVYLAKTELASTPESEEKKNALDSLQEIEKNLDYINKIVQDLQDFAKPLKPNVEKLDLQLIIQDLMKKNGLPENVKFIVKIQPEARNAVADSTFINRILYNLVNNAIQAMPNGGELTIDVYKEASDSIITVKDSGVGIPEAVKHKLFTPMFTTKAKGQGFGLAVVKRMTEALGGKITFDSQTGQGTTFIVRLPPPKRVKK
jgi:two-component system CheB/CheR fusion protein